MFARVLDTAKRILSRSPSVQERSSQARDSSPVNPLDNDDKERMVTTRGGVETPGTTGATPRSSAKKKARKRQLESQDIPSHVKRQKKTPPLVERELESESLERPSFTEDVEQGSEHSDPYSAQEANASAEDVENEEGLPIRRRTSPSAQAPSPEPHQSPIDSTPKTEKSPKESPKQMSSAKRANGRKKKAQGEDIAEPSNSKTTSQPKKTHMRFGSEEPEPVAPKERESNVAGDDDDDYESDSSEAPEVIASATAASKAKSIQLEAQRALEAQAAKEEAKREKRKARIAEEQAQKRLRDEKKAKKLAKKLAKQQRIASSSPKDDEEQEEEDIDLAKASDTIPALLPESLLNSIDEQRPPTPPFQPRGKTKEERRKEKLNRHIKFLERSQKPVKDVKKGKLTVSVLREYNNVLPPKMNKNSQNIREHWLKGRAVKKRKGGKPNFKTGKMERRSHGIRSFLRAGED